MPKMLRVALVLAVGWVVMGAAGEAVALLSMSALSQDDGAVWVLTVGGLLLALAAPLIAYSVVRSGRRLGWIPRSLLATFAAFFCLQLALGGIQDWSPFPVLVSLLVCSLAGLSVALMRDAQ